MPRVAREKSKSGIYHIILRGTNRQEIFHDDQDNVRFLETLDRYKKKTKIKVHGWCLMSNHIHLLIEEGKEELATTMKRIGVSFVWYYNFKYRTTGHLFQDRYRSEKVESNEYLMTVIRYLHQNPVKSETVKSPSEWKWSSCNGYYGNEAYPKSLLDNELVLGLFSDDKKTAIRKFTEFNEAQNEDCCMDDIITTRLTDEEARIEIKKLLEGFEIAQIKSLQRDKRDEIIKRVKEIEGLTQRQLARILGLSQSLIFRV